MEPVADRPWMPGYGTLPAADGTGLLPWSWATERLEAAHDFWLATTSADGRPHVMPVWAVWWRDALWFSSGAVAQGPQPGARPALHAHHGAPATQWWSRAVPSG